MIKKLLGALLLSTILAFGQNPNTPAFPGAAATDTDLFVANNGIGGTALNGSITNADTSIVLTSGTRFVSPVIIAIEGEIIHCTTLTTNTLSGCVRGLEGTTAVSHSSGKIAYAIQTAWYHNQVAAEIKAVETWAIGIKFPFTFVQESGPVSASATTPFTVTFPQTTAASGNTAWLICALDGSGSVTLPAGWTVDINQVQAGFVRLAVLHKTTAAESSAAFSTSGNQPYACYFFEQTGLHTLDVSSTGGSANAQVLTLPSITPTANSVVFSVAVVVPNNAPSTPIFAQTPLNPNWKRIDVGLDTGRSLLGFMSTIPASNVLTKPPQLAIQGPLFTGGGMAYATFSIL